MTTSRYHHGDLREAAIREATAEIGKAGVEALSLRKLAERVGVSPPALYHHFRDKNDLLCAIATRGFAELERIVDATERLDATSIEARLRAFVHAYVGFAAENPETYDLMFGRAIWHVGAPTPELRAIAFRTFRRYVEQVARLASHGAPRTRDRALRRAQVGWATLHGLCRLRIDRIYVDVADLDAMTEEAAHLILVGLRA